MIAILLVLAVGAVAVVLLGSSRALAYVKGQPTWITVTPIDNGATLRSDAAESYFALKAAAARAGHALAPSGPRAGYRSTEDQVALLKELGAYGADTDGDGVPDGVAARVNHSPHQAGTSIDFDNLNPSRVDRYRPKLAAWMHANAPSFGWFPVGETFKTVREPWHWEFDADVWGNRRVS